MTRQITEHNQAAHAESVCLWPPLMLRQAPRYVLPQLFLAIQQKQLLIIQQIAILYRTTATAPKTAQELASMYQTQCRAYQADVTVPAQISATIDEVVKDFGKLDVVVANAGICSEHAAEEYTPEEFQEIMDVNVNGAFHTAQAAARVFKEQGFGNVVFTASVSATLVNTPQRQAAVGVSWLPCADMKSHMLT